MQMAVPVSVPGPFDHSVPSSPSNALPKPFAVEFIFSGQNPVKKRQLSKQYASFKKTHDQKVSVPTTESATLNIPVFETACQAEKDEARPTMVPVSARLAPRLENQFPVFNTEFFDDREAFVNDETPRSVCFTSQLSEHSSSRSVDLRESRMPAVLGTSSTLREQVLPLNNVNLSMFELGAPRTVANFKQFSEKRMQFGDAEMKRAGVTEHSRPVSGHGSVLGKRRFFPMPCRFCKASVYDSSYPTMVHDGFICGVLPLIVTWRYRHPEVAVELEDLLFDVEAQCSQFSGLLYEDFCVFWTSNYEEYLSVLIESRALGLDRLSVSYMSLYRNCCELMNQL